MVDKAIAIFILHSQNSYVLLYPYKLVWRQLNKKDENKIGWDGGCYHVIKADNSNSVCLVLYSTRETELHFIFACLSLEQLRTFT